MFKTAIVIILISAASLAVVPSKALAQYGLSETGGKIGYDTNEKTGTVYVVVNKVVGAVLALIGFFFFGIMMYGGIRYMTARGNEEFTTKAKEAIYAGIIGMAIVVSSYALTSFVFGKLIGGGG